MIKKNIIAICLCLIVLLGFAFRFYLLGKIAPSLYWDEVALGYNAYSLGIDGKDEFGKFLPYIALESFGDYKPPLYSYLDIIPVKILGLNEFAVRFPSALFGSLAILLTFFLVREIFPKKEKEEKRKIEYVGLAASLFLAISPWHIMLSRGAFEANIASFLIILGALLFLKAANGKKKLFIASAIPFALTFYTFNSSRVFVPIFVLGLGLLCYKKLLQSKKEILISGILGFILIFPIIPFLLSPQASTRFKEVNIFSDPQIVINSNAKIAEHSGSPIAKIIYNRRIGYLNAYMDHYLDNLSPKFLFLTGDGNPRFSVQKVGELLLIELPFLILGIVYLLKRREGYWYIIPFWLLAGIIPAAFARETPHALRIESAVPMFQILVGYGLINLLFIFRSNQRKILSVAIGILILINSLYFLNVLVSYYPNKYASEWQYGYKDAVKTAYDNKGKFQKVYFTDELGRPYINYLFYNNIAPDEFRNNSDIERNVFGFVTVKRIGNIYFVPDVDQKFISESSSLFIDYVSSKGLNADIPSNAKVIKKIYLPDKSSLFVVYKK